MSQRFEANVFQSGTADYVGMGTHYLVQTVGGVLYVIGINADVDVYFVKSTDGGLTWSTKVAVASGITATQLAIWYDRWSGIAAGKIHVVWSESAADDISYNSIDTENSDALSGVVVVFAGGSTASGGSLSITRARGGNLVVAGSIDAGAEDGAWKSTDAGATWAAAIADPSEAATTDQYLLAPGWNADNQDVMLYFWDASANEISVKRYDDSANTWTETSIATSMVELASSTGFPNFAVAVDLANSRNVLIAWTQADLANADLRCWTITDAAITEVTNVVLNSTDDQGLAALAIDSVSGDWYAYYVGKSDGSETFITAVKLYCKVSTDDGTTWGSETLLSPDVAATIRSLYGTNICQSPYGAPPPVLMFTTARNTYVVNANWPVRMRAGLDLGVM